MSATQGLLHRFIVRPLSEERSHVRVLTGIRGWAALWVYLYHVWGLAKHPPFELHLGGLVLDFTPLISMGLSGVSIFFVLSGFLIALPYAKWQAGLRDKPALGRYFSHRVTRVFPAYYAQLALLLLVAAVVPGQAGLADWQSVLRHLLMLFNPPPVGMTPINLVWWTLPIEFSFYLALPFLAFSLRPGRWWLLLVGSLMAMWLWRHFMVTWLDGAPIQMRVYGTYQLPGTFDMFGLGMLAAMLHVNRARFADWLLPRSTPGRLGVLGLLLVLVAIYWLPGRRAEYWADNLIFYAWTPALSLGIAAVIYAGVNGGRLIQRLFGNRFMVYAGLISYSFYLWHFPIITWIAGTAHYQSMVEHRFAWLLLVSAPAVFLVATLSYLLVERPGMRYLRRER